MTCAQPGGIDSAEMISRKPRPSRSPAVVKRPASAVTGMVPPGELLTPTSPHQLRIADVHPDCPPIDISTEQMVLSYSPFKEALAELKESPLLIVGDPKEKVMNVARSYGLSQAIHVSDYRSGTDTFHKPAVASRLTSYLTPYYLTRPASATR